MPKPKTFIVHGHDKLALLELKNYIQNKLNLDEPIILSEQASSGLTVIEKFEKYSKDVSLVFIILSPDDIVNVEIDGNKYQQPRPNVLIELGYFYGKLNRKSGNVILLSKSPIKLPTDLAGIMYIDISNGVENSGEKIRTEISAWL